MDRYKQVSAVQLIFLLASAEGMSRNTPNTYLNDLHFLSCSSIIVVMLC